jgi:UPF0755 protein
MASIVEKKPARPPTARWWRRCSSTAARGMLLQTDPTVIYGLGEAFDGNLRKRDLLADTPTTPTPAPACRPRRSPCPAWRPCARPSTRRPPIPLFRGPGRRLQPVFRTLDEHNRAVPYIRKRNP